MFTPYRLEAITERSYLQFQKFFEELNWRLAYFLGIPAAQVYTEFKIIKKTCIGHQKLRVGTMIHKKIYVLRNHETKSPEKSRQIFRDLISS